MITITKNERNVLDLVQKLNGSYEDGIPQNLLKIELKIHEYPLYEIVNSLKNKKLVDFEDNRVKLLDTDEKINTVNSKQDVIDAELNQIEQDSIELIKNIVVDGIVPKYELEGNLLYGNLNLSDFRMYHVIISLTNKGIIKPILKYGEQYYRLLLSD